MNLYHHYLNLLEDSLLGLLHSDPPLDPWHGIAVRESETVIGISPGPFNLADRLAGRDWPSTALTMIGKARMRQLREAVETVFNEGVDGDFIETGVWRGGACIYMAGVLAAQGANVTFAAHRTIYVADSFEGLPKGSGAEAKDQHHLATMLAVSEDEVRGNFVRYDLLGPNIVFVKGWFKDTLKELPARSLAILRLDGDMYSSTMEALMALYDRLSPSGFCIVDDYGAVAGCRKAVDEFRAEGKIQSPIVDIDGIGIYWRK